MFNLREALSGLFAYDSGCVDSGIRDELLRARAIVELHALSNVEVSRLIRDMWLSEEALEQGYGIEDLVEFLRWLGDRMDYQL